MKLCKVCRRQYKDIANYCIFCGKELSGQGEVSLVSPNESKTIYVSYVVGGVEKQVPCSSFPALIGRDSSNVDIPILHPSVSRSHCRLILSGDTILIEDNGSSNGTFINGQRVREATPFTDNDTITIGDVNVCIRMRTAIAFEEG